MEKTLPSHIAFIMDGNRRWARKRALPGILGHKKGVEVYERIVEECARRGIKVATFYTFSSENWKRPTDEVSGLMQLIADNIDRLVEKGMQNGIKYKIIGDLSRFPRNIQDKLARAVETSNGNTGMVLNGAVGYGGRDEIIRSVRKCVRKNLEINEENISLNMDTGDQPDPDLIIRTGGESRLSNFFNLAKRLCGALFHRNTVA